MSVRDFAIRADLANNDTARAGLAEFRCRLIARQNFGRSVRLLSHNLYFFSGTSSNTRAMAFTLKDHLLGVGIDGAVYLDLDMPFKGLVGGAVALFKLFHSHHLPREQQIDFSLSLFRSFYGVGFEK